MKVFNKILFPIDFSDVSPKMVSWVKSIAEPFDAEIHLLFVVRRFDYFTGIYVEEMTVRNIEGEVIEGAEKRIDEFAGTHFDKVSTCKTKVVVGDAAEEIITYAKAEGMDLIVMGTHGRKGLDRVFFGSVAERVIKTASVPVLSVNPYRVSVLEEEIS
jgi:nucleotide-binding universal stress UspA family protein